jgi:hypothetical protein
VYLRSENGSQFTARRVKSFLKDMGVDTLFIEPGSPWENGYVESFNGRMRDELLDGELFLHIDGMKYVVERWRMDYNHYRPHSSLGYMTLAGFAQLCRQAGCLRPQTPVLCGAGQTVESSHKHWTDKKGQTIVAETGFSRCPIPP